MHKDVSVLRDASSSDADKARALRFLIHFVGDIHQPLHCTAQVTHAHPNGDRGGNLFKITATQHSSGRNLHMLWDSGLMTFPNGSISVPPPLASIGPAIQPIVAKYKPAPALKGKVDDFESWSQEGLMDAKEVVYKDITDGGEVTDAYLKRAIPLAQRKVAWAGYRLATLLNDIYK